MIPYDNWQFPSLNTSSTVFLIGYFSFVLFFDLFVRWTVALPCHLAMAIAQCERLSAIWKSNEQETTDLIRWNIYVNINRWKLNEHETWDLIRWNITSTTKDRNQMSNRSSSMATKKLLICSACKWCYFFFLSSPKKVKWIYWKTKNQKYISIFSRWMRASCKDRRGNFYGGSHHHYQLNQLKRQLSSPHHQPMQWEMEKSESVQTKTYRSTN